METAQRLNANSLICFLVRLKRTPIKMDEQQQKKNENCVNPEIKNKCYFIVIDFEMAFQVQFNNNEKKNKFGSINGLFVTRERRIQNGDLSIAHCSSILITRCINIHAC